MKGKKILVLQAAALGYELLKKNAKIDSFAGNRWCPLDSEFPAVTCTAQATLRTAEHPSKHGVIANGFYDRTLRKPFFWEQSSSILSAPLIWEQLRKSGKKVAQLFFQQSLGTDTDIVLSPAPIHKHHGGMIQDCYSRPADLYKRIVKNIGKRFNLRHYWGPLASIKASEWIGKAVCFTIEKESPDLILAYIPHLDYALQKHGPNSENAKKALLELEPILLSVISCAENMGYEAVVFGDYAITDVDSTVFPNRILREAGLFSVREIATMTYPDFNASRAFALVDHQVAHVYVRQCEDIQKVKDLFASTNGIEAVLDNETKRKRHIDHDRAGELILTASQKSWFAYPWWKTDKEMPEFATHVDIHSKPGYDPCELFFGKNPLCVSTRVEKVKGSHGNTGTGLEGAFFSSIKFSRQPRSIYELACELKRYIND